jgi:hypothetical protein
MHPWSEQFVKFEPYTNALGVNLSGVRMDLASKAETLNVHSMRGHTTASMRRAPDAEVCILSSLCVYSGSVCTRMHTLHEDPYNTQT